MNGKEEQGRSKEHQERKQGTGGAGWHDVSVRDPLDFFPCLADTVYQHKFLCRIEVMKSDDV